MSASGIAPQFEDVSHEVVFTTSRSSGPGGQNVNKVNSKVTLKWDIVNSERVDDSQRSILLSKLKSKLTKEGVLVIQAQESRSQSANKQEAVNKLNFLLKKAFTKKKKRKPTKPSKASVQKRVKEKKLKGEKKQWRQKPDH
ncbi:MAG: alternative ribosome rescue aminoacyl-tRNA hydrolase ArfB [Cyclobacteriaceae bacterium]